MTRPDTVAGRLAAWAVGQQPVQFMPKEVGMALPVKGSGHRFLVEVPDINVPICRYLLTPLLDGSKRPSMKWS